MMPHYFWKMLLHLTKLYKVNFHYLTVNKVELIQLVKRVIYCIYMKAKPQLYLHASAIVLSALKRPFPAFFL